MDKEIHAWTGTLGDVVDSLVALRRAKDRETLLRPGFCPPTEK
jgi:hypothetical protein